MAYKMIFFAICVLVAVSTASPARQHTRVVAGGIPRDVRQDRFRGLKPADNDEEYVGDRDDDSDQDSENYQNPLRRPATANDSEDCNGTERERQECEEEFEEEDTGDDEDVDENADDVEEADTGDDEEEDTDYRDEEERDYTDEEERDYTDEEERDYDEEGENTDCDEEAKDTDYVEEEDAEKDEGAKNNKRPEDKGRVHPFTGLYYPPFGGN